jgi:hypothetical protein
MRVFNEYADWMFDNEHGLEKKSIVHVLAARIERVIDVEHD